MESRFRILTPDIRSIPRRDQMKVEIWQQKIVGTLMPRELRIRVGAQFEAFRRGEHGVIGVYGLEPGLRFVDKP